MKCALLSLVALLPSLVFGQHIEIRVSVKIIVHPATGARPMGMTDTLLFDAARNANQWQASYLRGYRFRVTEIAEIGGPTQGGQNGPSKWFGQDPRGDEAWPVFQNEINTDARYRRRNNQVNFYITTGPSSNPGGACPIPPGETHLTACHGFVNDGPWWLNHELGHFFGLSHTFAGENRSTCTPGNSDGISDTLADSRCWTNINQAADYHYGKTYNQLNSAQKRSVEDVYYNVMSYHEAANKDVLENRMTELQLDRFADMANGPRNDFVSGRTLFAKPGTQSTGDGSSKNEYRQIAMAVTAANSSGTDIVLLRAGHYHQTLTITKPLTLRATRTGPAVIGLP